ncbi:peptide chain release factor H [Massilia sp. AB1]|uniref:peptide chain release factor H n=1 Tax=Massilia sp. AB1 TaxID=2823371 RepID=UPI001B81FFEF|nr:peptide chain release factor H [Massilia sp. AB1]MBQ5938586.1 peptide chain release factor H [Massilia sp. AB1]
MTTLMQISANTGPAECCLAVAKLLGHLEAKAGASGVTLTLVEETREGGSGLLQSVLLALEGEEAACRLFAAPYAGTILWVCPSPLRPAHRRKNWYLDVSLFAEPDRGFGDEVRFETMRSSGPGGQHANKTETAVRATHVATGLSVKIGGSRSQGANKAAALALLSARVSDHVDASARLHKAERRLRHCAKAGGEVVKRFAGPAFTEA